jgi:hypothetical protein
VKFNENKILTTKLKKLPISKSVKDIIQGLGDSWLKENAIPASCGYSAEQFFFSPKNKVCQIIWIYIDSLGDTVTVEFKIFSMVMKKYDIRQYSWGYLDFEHQLEVLINPV